MISIETVVAMAVRNPVVMDGLGEALRSDLVLSNPYYRRIVEFADDFMTLRRQLPGGGDWTTWIDSLTEGPIRDGTREALGRLFATDVSGHQPEFFAEQAIVHLRKAAAHVAVARINEMRATIEPEVFVALSKKLEAVESGGLRGLARLKDVDTWANPVREGEYTPTGYPTLDRLIGASFSTMPPWTCCLPACCARWCFLTIFTRSTITRSSLVRIRSTVPCCPRSFPAITCTVSPFLMRCISHLPISCDTA